MANTCLQLKSKGTMDACKPVRLQDIPRKTLKMYGIIFDDDSDTDQDESVLVIDESIDTSPEPSGNPERIPDFIKRMNRDNYCTTCAVFTDNLEKHLFQHCTQLGCPAWIPDSTERAYHARVHTGHPTKPFACTWCKKRYRFYCHMIKHYKVCKSRKKRTESAVSTERAF